MVRADREMKRKSLLRRKKLRKVWEYGSMGVWECGGEKIILNFALIENGIARQSFSEGGSKFLRC